MCCTSSVLQKISLVPLLCVVFDFAKFGEFGLGEQEAFLLFFWGTQSVADVLLSA